MDAISEEDAFVLTLSEAMATRTTEPQPAFMAAFISVLGSTTGVLNAEGSQRVQQLDLSEKIREEERRIRRARYLFGQLRRAGEDTRDLISDLVDGKPMVF
jgi:hypothetical protein